ncbi:glycerophosphodiester phosphodiesterase family protein [Rhodocytophaga rosea]|uniref:Glycerophosphodiester phosphodiesterase family protein n=1 Tax=Rhodocytophaga rosea TaxID=2704465 RepID=A0A6C0GFZ3_9BACT|nr:glycerophosphodiester phosphodiesterase family protein [Rhodocytophaga rosea]QHT66662.1 glycerophosphodiester phosphodiesterase family protein [Rhodocytophaga rosea]
MRIAVSILVIFFIEALFLPVCSFSQNYFIRTTHANELQEFLRRTPDRIPLVSAHRGGPAPGFPENCLATFDHTLQNTYALIECDVQLSKDSMLVMMHDDKLERTSNGTSKVADKTWQELQKLKLKDNNGTLTPYSIPTLAQVLQWAKGKTILTVDVKRGVPPQKIVQAIQQEKAEGYSVIITYSMEAVRQYHQLDSSLVISVTCRNIEELNRLKASGIPPKNVVAFVGITEPEPALYEALHQKGISCILGTIGNLDRSAEARQTNVYANLVKNGADILATDKPIEASASIEELILKKSSKRKFFKK